MLYFIFLLLNVIKCININIGLREERLAHLTAENDKINLPKQSDIDAFNHIQQQENEIKQKEYELKSLEKDISDKEREIHLCIISIFIYFIFFNIAF